ncbi:MraY family glycosyltransferase [Desulfurococcus mucosus]|uniref:MraY family glycosyltransferase n=1 Tax=Desulfurococcus mucosus TaxID=2275 RepID=UPI00064E9240|nr:glycosyltransferase 4 family protein [Desulfurococcus mucosus]
MSQGAMADALGYLVPVAVSAATAWLLLDWWVDAGWRLGLKGRDMNKPGEHYAVEAGGVWVLLGAAFGILSYVALDTYLSSDKGSVEYFAVSQVLVLAGLLGLMDDILGWKKGLSQVKRVLLTLPISFPLVVVKAGYTSVELPLIGVLDLGPLYPLLVVPVGVMGASNAFNMIAGYNGLEALQALIITGFTLLFALKKGIVDVIPLLLVMAAAILVFLRYNWCPARVFPGNTFTYGFGAFYASIVIYGNFEKFGLALFTPYFIELALFIRGLLNGVYKENFSKPTPEGCLKPPYSKHYSLTHLAITVVEKLKGCAGERSVVAFITLIEAAAATVALILL